jgi:hypothetical protein
MPAYQLTYNPAKSNWDGQKEDWWACYTKKVQQDDEVFLLRVGQIPEAMKGLIGRGIATTASCRREGQWVVNFRLSVVARKDEPPLVPLSTLKQLPGDQHWSHQRSGIEIKPEAVEALHRLLGSPVPPPAYRPLRGV